MTVQSSHRSAEPLDGVKMLENRAGSLPTVLHIDDDELSRYVVARVLKQAGFAMKAAKTGEEGLQALADSPPDLIILDVQLPGISGFDVCREIKATPRNAVIPVLHLSAHFTQGQDKAQGLDSGADAYLAQPVEPIELIATVKALLRIRKAEESLRFLAEASKLLAHSLDCDTILRTLVDLAVPYLADWCVIHRVYHDGSIHPLIVFHAELSKVKLGWNLTQQYPVSDRDLGIQQVIQTKQPVFLADLSDSVLTTYIDNADHRHYLQELGLQSGIVVPLIVHQQVFGIIGFATAESGRCYRQADLNLVQDLTMRAALAIENAQLYREAQEANRMKDEFLATLSHELRSPLNAILGWTRLLNTRKFNETTTARAMETIERSAMTQAQLVEDLLDVSQIIRGKLRLNVQPMDLTSAIQAEIATVQPSAAAKNIQIQFVFEPDIGLISGDLDRLQQVIWNLLSNAVKFTPENGQITIFLQRCQSHIQFILIDTGKGIDPEFAPFVFDRFRQADSSSTRTYSGLGLGLAIVRHLVELHGGTVKVSSKGENQGSTFTVKLPLMLPGNLSQPRLVEVKQ
jgi:signal transduction histidine kinase/FixJ family two-component response regulator